MEELVRKLISSGVLKNENIIGSFLACDRKNFVLRELLQEAYVDVPLPVGFGQTISQPSTVAFMLELLAPRHGQKILDIGFGSAWTTALLAYIVGKEGKVYGLEILPDVLQYGKSNLAKFHFTNVTLFNRSGWLGLPEAAPFDRILVSAVAGEAPEPLKMQLKVGGKMVIPMGSTNESSICMFEKISENKFREEKFEGFAFVPLVKK